MWLIQEKAPGSLRGQDVLSKQYKTSSCESIDALHKTALSFSPTKNRKRERGRQDRTRMTLKPQKAQINKAKAASKESEHQTPPPMQRIQSEVEEATKNDAGAKKSAQKQHDAQPEVASKPQGLNETQCPALPGREDAVPGRRKSDEFALRVSEAALMHMAHREPGYLPMVKEAAYERIYESERLLCGHIVQIGKVPAVNMLRWWRAFYVDGLWFVLKPCEPPRFSKVREYELLPASGPTPDDDTPPTLRREQKTPPPEHIGPRRRRNRGDASGSRAAPGPTQAKGKKSNEAKRLFMELYDSAYAEFELLSQKFAHKASQLWKTIKPRLLRNLVQIRRFRSECGNVVHDVRDAIASLVQVSRQLRVFSILGREALTRQEQLAPETFGPAGRLESSNAGHVISARLRLNSWKWDEPPLPWAEYLFGVDWTLNIFGVLEEEQVFA